MSPAPPATLCLPEVVHDPAAGASGAAGCTGSWRRLTQTLKDVWGVQRKRKGLLGRGAAETEAWGLDGRRGQLDQQREGPSGRPVGGRAFS